MIEVELKEAPEGPGEYRVVARLTVNDDGTYQLDDPETKLLTPIPVLVDDQDAEDGVRQVFFEDDPATWARNVEVLYRSGIWVAEVVADTDAPEVTS